MYSFVLPGRYTLDVPGLPENAYIAGIRQRGGLDESGIVVIDETLLNIEVLIDTRGATVEGDVEDKNQIPLSGARVVLVPQGARRENVTAHKSATANNAGHFILRGIAPGEYKLFAGKSIPANAHLNAEFLGKYEQQGQSFQVNPARATPLLKIVASEVAP